MKVLNKLTVAAVMIASVNILAISTAAARDTAVTEVHVGKGQSGRESFVATPGRDSPVTSSREGKVEKIDFAKEFRADAGPRGELRNAKESETRITRDK